MPCPLIWLFGWTVACAFGKLRDIAEVLHGLKLCDDGMRQRHIAMTMPTYTIMLGRRLMFLFCFLTWNCVHWSWGLCTYVRTVTSFVKTPVKNYSTYCKLKVNRPANRVNLVFMQKPDNYYKLLVTLNYLKVIHFRHVSTMMINHHHDRSFKYYSCTKATERLWKVWS